MARTCESCGSEIKDREAYRLTRDDYYVHENGVCGPLPGEPWERDEDPDVSAGNAQPCPRCLALVQAGKLRVEMLQPLRGGARDALAVDGSGHCCRDCKAADTLMRFTRLLDFQMARIAIGNDRQEQLRLPGVPMGYVKDGIMEKSEPGELDQHHAWLARVVPDLWAHGNGVR